jgi:predicted phosphodiesterase
MTIGKAGFAGNNSISAPFVAVPNPQKRSLVRRVLKRLLSWNGTDNSQPTKAALKGVTVACISDTHNLKPELPYGHILVHAGDLSQYGLFDEIQAQLDWLNSQPHLHKIVVPGNHDLLLDQTFVKRHPDRELDSVPGKLYRDLRWGNIKCLVDSSIEVVVGDETVTIFGSPLTPRCGNFAFQYDRATDVWKNKLPNGVDILLTHGPPALHLDEDKGCRYLLRELRRVQPSLVVFGHIHSGGGEEWVDFNEAQVCYEEALLGNWPWIHVPWLALRVAMAAIRRMFHTKHQSSKVHLVNAAVAPEAGNRKCKEPIVVDI